MTDAPSAAGESASQGARGIGQGLSSRVGPLPVWGWLAVLGVGGVLVYVFVIRRGAGGTAYSGFGFPTGGGGGGGGGSTVTPPTLNNSAWLTSAIQGTVTGLGLTEAEVAYYLNEGLAGNRPTGNTQAYSTFQKVWDYATQNFGQPPVAPGTSTPGASFYTTQQSWFNDVLAFLPSGTSASVTAELQALFSGTTSTISQDAANAYNAAIGIIGLGPTGGLSYTVTTGTTGTQQITQNQANSFLSWWGQYANVGGANQIINQLVGVIQNPSLPGFGQGPPASGVIPTAIAGLSTNQLTQAVTFYVNNPQYFSQVWNGTAYGGQQTTQSNFATLWNNLLAGNPLNQGLTAVTTSSQ